MKTPAYITTASLEEYTGSWTRVQAAHLGRRLLFGVTRDNIARLSSMPMSEAVDSLLMVSQQPPSPPAYSTLNGIQQGSTWLDAPYDLRFEPDWLLMLQAWWVGEMLYQSVDKPPTITEKMTLFWHNHFATEANMVNDARYMYKQNALFRQYALGNFKELVKHITLDPAMLRFLNGSDNVKEHPNENFGRELQELFTVGKGTSGSTTTYTEEDIKQAARILTGWVEVTPPISVVFIADNHDSGNKQFSASYGNTIIKGGEAEKDARKELDELITMIFANQETSKFIIRKLYCWFVDCNINETIEKNIIAPLAEIFIKNNFEVKPVLQTLFKSTHFYNEAVYGAIIKNPVEYVVGTIRAFPSATFYPASTAYQEQYIAWRTLHKTMASIQMELLSPPNVAGWPAYWQKPSFYQIWINLATLQKRSRFISDVCSDGLLLDDKATNTLIDVIPLAMQSSTPDDINVLINDWCEIAFPLPAPDEVKKQLKQIVLNGLPDYEWTAEWNAYVSNQADTQKKKNVEDKLRGLLRYILSMAEYQVS